MGFVERLGIEPSMRERAAVTAPLDHQARPLLWVSHPPSIVGDMPMATLEEQRAYQREWLRRRRQEWLDENGPCVDCGGTERLEVDHVDASTKVTNAVWSWARERREAELAKCVVRCHDCHKAKTKRCREYAHGTRSGGAKLTEDQVLDIRRSSASGESYGRIAARYGVDRGRIGGIVRCEKWKYLVDDGRELELVGAPRAI